MATREREVRDRGGAWYLLRVRPYRTSDNRIEGAFKGRFPQVQWIFFEPDVRAQPPPTS